MKESEKIQTFLPDGSKGEYILKSKYEQWSRFILAALNTEENFTLNDILERARTNAPVSQHNEIAWNILQVKRDLEARGLVTAQQDPDTRHTYYLKLTRQGFSKASYDSQLDEWSKLGDGKTN